MFRKTFGRGFVWVGLGLALASAGEARSDEPVAGSAAVEELVHILESKGLIDEDQRDQILLKHYAEQARASAAPEVRNGLAEGFEWFGDLRLRHEGFYYDKDDDDADPKQDDRTRFRYRARFGFKKAVNEWAKVGMRLASGSCRDTSGDLQDCGDPRSTNRTLGDDDDFDPDEIFIETAWADFKLPEYEGIKSNLQAGKITNPFFWKQGKDFLVFDNDITPEGVALMSRLALGEDANCSSRPGASWSTRTPRARTRRCTRCRRAPRASWPRTSRAGCAAARTCGARSTRPSRRGPAWCRSAAAGTCPTPSTRSGPRSPTCPRICAGLARRTGRWCSTAPRSAT
jgi:hypothetical protein